MDWSKLNHLQLGKYGEYLAKMEFIKNGFDVYTAEVDDKGIDFIVRNSSDSFFEIQVKSIRNKSYVFMRKEVFLPRETLYLALLIFSNEEQPVFALVPSTAWLNEGRPDFLVDRANYAVPEFGINVSSKSIDAIKAAYPLSSIADKQVAALPVKDL